MNFLTNSFFSALLLIRTLDHNLVEIIGVSLKVSFSSTIISALVGIPSEFLIAFSDFKGKRLLIIVHNTLLALPTVVIGLFVYIFGFKLRPHSEKTGPSRIFISPAEIHISQNNLNTQGNTRKGKSFSLTGNSSMSVFRLMPEYL